MSAMYDSASSTLARELIERASAEGVDAIQLLPSPDGVLYRAWADGVLLELHTALDVEAVADLAAELTCGGAPEPLRIQLRPGRDGWTVTLGREPGVR